MEGRKTSKLQATFKKGKAIYKQLIGPTISLVLTGIAINLLLGKIASIQESTTIMRSFSWWAIILAILSQIISYIGAGYLIKSILETYGKRFSIKKSTLIYLASTSVGLFGGGTFGSTATIYKLLKKQNVDRQTATFSSFLPAFLNNILILIISTIGIFILFITRTLNKDRIFEYSLFLLGLLAICTFIAIFLYFPKISQNIAKWAIKMYTKITKKEVDEKKIIDTIEEYYTDWKNIKERKLKKMMTGAGIFLLFDMLTLFFVFLSSGYSVNIGTMTIGYAIAILVSKLAFVIPGGIGLFEASMIGLFISLGVPKQIAISVTAVYRLLSFWIPSLTGFASLLYLRKKSPKSSKDIMPVKE